MTYIGDIALSQTIDDKFCTVQSTGAPTTLAGTPVISNYVGNGTIQITAGITLTVDFDGVTGLNNVRTVASGANGYAAQTDVQSVITTGTVNSVSAVGYVVSRFSIENRSSLRPTTAGRTLDIAATGEAGLDFANTNFPVGAILPLGIIDNGTLQAATVTTAQLRAAASFADSRLVGMTLVITGGTGVGQARIIDAYVNATDTATVIAWTTTPDNTSTYSVYPTPPAGTDALSAAAVSAAAVTKIQNGLATAVGVAAVQADTDDLQTRMPAALVGGRMDTSVGAMAANVMTAAAAAADLTTELQAGLATAAALATAKTAIDSIQTDTDDIQTRIPAALTANGNMKSDILRINGVVVIGVGTSGNKWRA